MKTSSKPVRNRVWYPVAVGLLIGIVVYFVISALHARRAFQQVELKTYDWFLDLQPRDSSLAGEVVVVGIDEDDLHSGQFRYPLGDVELAKLLQTILQCGPRTVGVDIFRDLLAGTPEDRAQLAGIWTKNPNVVFVTLLSSDEADQNTIAVSKPAGLPDRQAGFADFVLDHDGVVRRSLLFQGGPDPNNPGKPKTYSSMALRLARNYLLGEQPPVVLAPVDPAHPIDFKLGRTIFRHFEANDGAYVGADPRGIQFLLDFKSLSFRHFSGSDILNRKFRPEDLRGKIVLIGMTAISIKDYFQVPVGLDPAGARSNTKIDRRPRLMQFGVDTHAATVHQLLRAALDGSEPIRVWTSARKQAWLFIWSVAGAGIALWLRRPLLCALAVAAGLAMHLLLAYAYFRHNWWIPVVPSGASFLAAAVAVAAYLSYRERADRMFLMLLFSSHVAKAVAEEIWDERHAFLQKGKLRAQPLTATVLFTDLRGFSKVAGQLSAEQLMEWLNDLMTRLSAVVDERDGIVSKYIGDALMALFGVPIPRKTRGELGVDARNAVLCALEMRRILTEFNADHEKEGIPAIQMRIGIYTGNLVAGSLGSKDRLEYTVIGDTVNIANRLESYRKDLMDPAIAPAGCRILIGQPTLELLDNQFHVRSLGDVTLEGVSVPIGASSVISEDRPPDVRAPDSASTRTLMEQTR